MSLSEAIKTWWTTNPAQRITVTAVSVSSVIAAIFAVLHFWQLAEPYWFATRMFTRELVTEASDASKERDSSSAVRIISVEIAVKESERGSVQSQIDRINVELAKVPQESISLRGVLNDQLRQYSDHIKNIEREIEDLQRQRFGPH